MNSLNAKGRLLTSPVRADGRLVGAITIRAVGRLVGAIKMAAHYTMHTNIRKEPPYLTVTPTEVQWIDVYNPVEYTIETNAEWKVR